MFNFTRGASLPGQIKDWLILAFFQLALGLLDIARSMFAVYLRLSSNLSSFIASAASAFRLRAATFPSFMQNLTLDTRLLRSAPTTIANFFRRLCRFPSHDDVIVGVRIVGRHFARRRHADTNRLLFRAERGEAHLSELLLYYSRATASIFASTLAYTAVLTYHGLLVSLPRWRTAISNFSPRAPFTGQPRAPFRAFLSPSRAVDLWRADFEAYSLMCDLATAELDNGHRLGTGGVQSYLFSRYAFMLDYYSSEDAEARVTFCTDLRLAITRQADEIDAMLHTPSSMQYFDPDRPFTGLFPTFAPHVELGLGLSLGVFVETICSAYHVWDWVFVSLSLHAARALFRALRAFFPVVFRSMDDDPVPTVIIELSLVLTVAAVFPSIPIAPWLFGAFVNCLYHLFTDFLPWVEDSAAYAFPRPIRHWSAWWISTWELFLAPDGLFGMLIRLPAVLFHCGTYFFPLRFRQDLHRVFNVFCFYVMAGTFVWFGAAGVITAVGAAAFSTLCSQLFLSNVEDSEIRAFATDCFSTFAALATCESRGEATRIFIRFASAHGCDSYVQDFGLSIVDRLLPRDTPAFVPQAGERAAVAPPSLIEMVLDEKTVKDKLTRDIMIFAITAFLYPVTSKLSKYEYRKHHIAIASMVGANYALGNRPLETFVSLCKRIHSRAPRAWATNDPLYIFREFSDEAAQQWIDSSYEVLLPNNLLGTEPGGNPRPSPAQRLRRVRDLILSCPKDSLSEEDGFKLGPVLVELRSKYRSVRRDLYGVSSSVAAVGIHLVGPAGSGKTMLAKHTTDISYFSRYGVPAPEPYFCKADKHSDGLAGKSIVIADDPDAALLDTERTIPARMVWDLLGQYRTPMTAAALELKGVNYCEAAAVVFTSNDKLMGMQGLVDYHALCRRFCGAAYVEVQEQYQYDPVSDNRLDPSKVLDKSIFPYKVTVQRYSTKGPRKHATAFSATDRVITTWKGYVEWVTECERLQMAEYKRSQENLDGRCAICGQIEPVCTISCGSFTLADEDHLEDLPPDMALPSWAKVFEPQSGEEVLRVSEPEPLSVSSFWPAFVQAVWGLAWLMLPFLAFAAWKLVSFVFKRPATALVSILPRPVIEAVSRQHRLLRFASRIFGEERVFRWGAWVYDRRSHAVYYFLGLVGSLVVAERVFHFVKTNLVRSPDQRKFIPQVHAQPSVEFSPGGWGTNLDSSTKKRQVFEPLSNHVSRGVASYQHNAVITEGAEMKGVAREDLVNKLNLIIRRASFVVNDREFTCNGYLIPGGFLFNAHMVPVVPPGPCTVTFSSIGEEISGYFKVDGTVVEDLRAAVTFAPDNRDFCILPIPSCVITSKLQLGRFMAVEPPFSEVLPETFIAYPHIDGKVGLLETEPLSDIRAHFHPATNIHSYVYDGFRLKVHPSTGFCMAPVIMKLEGSWAVAGFHVGVDTDAGAHLVEPLPAWLLDRMSKESVRATGHPVIYQSLDASSDVINPVQFRPVLLGSLNQRSDLHFIPENASVMPVGSSDERMGVSPFRVEEAAGKRADPALFEAFRAKHGLTEYVVPRSKPYVDPDGVYRSAGRSFFSSLGIASATVINFPLLAKVAVEYGTSLVPHMATNACMLTFELAIHGQADRYVNPMDLTTSLGPPYVGPKRQLITLSEDGQWLTAPKVFFEGARLLIERWAAGFATPTVATYSLKDEPVKKSKAAAMDLRFIAVLPFVFNVAGKMVTQCVIALFAANPYLGIPFLDRSSQEFETFFVNHFVHPNFATGDFSKMDRRFSPSILWAIALAMATLVSLCPWVGITFTMMFSCVMSLHALFATYRGDYFWISAINSSGNFFTLMLNCFYFIITLRYGWAALGTGLRFDDHVKYAVIGDDTIVNLSDEALAAGFTSEYIVLVFESIGGVLTDANDKDIAPVIFRETDGIDFCSRVRRRHDELGCWVWALSKDRLLRSLSFRGRTSAPLRQRELDVLDQVALEAAYWGREFFDEIRPLLRACARAHSLRDPRGWDQCFAILAQRYEVVPTPERPSLRRYLDFVRRELGFD